MAPAEMNNSQLRNEIKQIKDILSLNEHPESAAHLYLNQLNKELKQQFKNK